MSEEQRQGLTIFLLVILGYGSWRAIHAAIQSNHVYRTMPGARGRVRNPLQTAKWLIVTQNILLWLTVQGWLDPMELLRPVFFVAVAITDVLLCIMLDRGYTRWWKSIGPYLAKLRR